MLTQFNEHKKQRAKLDIPAKPLNAEQTSELIALLQDEQNKNKKQLLELLKNQIPTGVDEAANIKAGFLKDICYGKIKISAISPADAVDILATMQGGACVSILVDLLDDKGLAKTAADRLSGLILVYDEFERIKEKSKTNKYALKVLQNWANASWFSNKPPLAEKISVLVFKVAGETNTDDLSPASEAFSRPDIPLHAQAMLQKKDKNAIQTIKKLKTKGYPVAFVGDVVGTGSSRKSAINSILWHIGENIPFVPNKRRGGVIIANKIAPIFFNSGEDAGTLCIECDVTSLSSGDLIHIYPYQGKICKEKDQQVINFKLQPATLKDEIQAQGRTNLIIGRALSKKAAKTLNLLAPAIFTEITKNQVKGEQKYTLAQKIVARACDKKGVRQGEYVEAKVSTVASQDTTGPMTVDELKDLAAVKFSADLVMQSFCHTSAYPKKIDIQTHKNLPPFFQTRGGVALKPKDGVVHSWLNRMIIPDTLTTGGDSHTRTPLGISFPAGSGMVAFAATCGMMPLDMPESVKVEFSGNMQQGITLRDMVNAVAFVPLQDGRLTLNKENKKNIYAGKIIEICGLPNLKVEQAFELSDSSAERSAAACTIELKNKPVIEYIRSNITLLKYMVREGYKDKETLKRRIKNMQEWLDDPVLLKADEGACYSDVVKINMDEIKQPLIACPNDPDDVKVLDNLADTRIDEVFIGSCMTNIGHFRAAAFLLEKIGQAKVPLWIAPPTKMDEKQLVEEGLYNIFAYSNARMEPPGCSLCMGNQARATSGKTVFSTSTRNFPNRLGDNTQVFLGSAELATICAIKGKIPSLKEYQEIMTKIIEPNKSKIYKYLNFDKMTDYTKVLNKK
jgi:aconitate hydratase 2 / 2-methylisocitrate dehydratase